MQDSGSSLYTGAVEDVPANAAPLTYRDASHNPGTDYGTGVSSPGVDASGPLGDSATTFNGTTGYIQTASPITSPQTFTIAVWFKGSTSGMLLGFGNNQGEGSAHHDRELWLDPSGNVVFDIWPEKLFEVASSGTNYMDGKWHLAVVMVTPATATMGTVLLYIDGSLAAGSAEDEPLSGGLTGQSSPATGTSATSPSASPPTPRAPRSGKARWRRSPSRRRWSSRRRRRPFTKSRARAHT